VCEVDEFTRLNTGEQAGTSAHFERVPTYVGNFFATFGKAGALFWKVGEARLTGRFARSGVEPLHADADAQKWNAARDGCANGGRKAGLVEIVCGGKMAYAGEDDALGGFDRSEIAIGDHGLCA